MRLMQSRDFLDLRGRVNAETYRMAETYLTSVLRSQITMLIYVSREDKNI